MANVFIDTSAYIAGLRPSEQHYLDARRIAWRLAYSFANLYTTNFVVAETHALILGRIGRVQASQFLHATTQSAIRVIRVEEMDETKAKQLIYTHADKDYSYTDALSFIIMERLHIREAFTFDDHFAQYGFTVLS